MRKTSGMAMGLLLVAACTKQPAPEVKSDLPGPSLSAVSAERDSLMQQVVDNARLMSDIGAALAKVSYRGRPGKVVSESPMQATRDSLLWMVRDVSTRVNEGEARLKATRLRIALLTTLSDSLRSKLDSTVTELQGAIENQRSTIASLNGQINDLKAENSHLVEVQTALTDTLQTMTQRDNTVYYVVGTKEDLLRKGIITEEGGSRLLFIFGKQGTTLAPARDLNPSDFTSVDMRTTTDIPLPDADHRYRIASRQSVAFLADTSVVHDGMIQGSSLKIGSPTSFWLPSKFLIVVEES